MSVYHKDNPNHLKSAIESILMQTHPTNDFVIVKDGPIGEELTNVLLSYENENIRIIDININGGLGRALNIGISKCKNDLIARMDSDDISIANRMEIQVREFDKNPKLELIGSHMMEFESNEKIINSIKKVPISKENIIEYSKCRNPFNHPTVMYKKSVITKLGGYKETKRGEDLEFFLNVVYSEIEYKNINEYLLKYRANFNQYKRRKTINETKTIIKIYFKHYKLKNINIMNLFCVIILQSINLLIPSKIGYLLYKSVFRNKISKGEINP